MKAGVIQECKRRRHFENKQDERKRKTREAAKRNSRRRRSQFRSSQLVKHEEGKVEKDDDEKDNWELPRGLPQINENDLFNQDWRSRSRVQVLQYVFLKWKMAFLVGLVATLINLAVENIAGYTFLLVAKCTQKKRYLMGFLNFAGANFLLTLMATVLCVCLAPTAAVPGVPEIKAYLNGVDTPSMFGASTVIVKIIGSIGAVSASLDLGKEGPLVHIGTCIASLLGQGGTEKYQLKWRWLCYLNNDRDRRDLITCGSLSGVRLSWEGYTLP